MPMKPRKTKSLSQIQHNDNVRSPWDDDGDKNDSETKNNGDAEHYGALFRLPDGGCVRPVRRSDAKAMHQVLNEDDIHTFFTDSSYPPPFSFWRVHKEIDEMLDQDKKWKRQNPTHSELQIDAYERAVQALADHNLDAKLSTQILPPQSTTSDSPSKAKQSPLVPSHYAIANADDVLIGLIDISFEDPLVAPSDSTDPCEPAFLHNAEICYLLSRPYRGRGLMTAVVRGFVDWAWRSFAQLERIEAFVFATWNEPSCRVLEKNGFVLEGCAKGVVRKRGEFGDLMNFCIFRPGGQLEKHSLGKDVARLRLKS